MSDLYDAGNDVEAAFKALIESQYRLMTIMQQQNVMMSQAINALTMNVAAPRKLMTDAAGNPTGVMPVHTQP